MFNIVTTNVNMDATAGQSRDGKEHTNAVVDADIINDEVQLHSFSEQSDDAILHFQIIRLSKQLYIWIGCNSAKFGHLYASMPTPFDKAPSLTALIGGGADSTGASMARRLALKTGWSIFMACNIPKNSPKLEANAERRLLQELKTLGYVEPKLKNPIL